MKNDKLSIRRKFILKRKKKYLTSKGFNFNQIFKLINKHFKNKKIVIAGYYPSNFEVNILSFLEEASKKKYKIALPVIKSSTKMYFKQWIYNEPLYLNKFGMLEPKQSKKNILPSLIVVPLVAYDNKLNRIGYGKGYYDRMLNKISKTKNIITVGIAYSFQECRKIPTNNYDFKLNYILTERSIIRSKNKL
tara:strand:+ start:976 stop:1548 length:573 start_codon:yes stop_codon:yes gene_type:complete